MTHDHLLSVDNDLKQNFDRTTKRIFGLNLYDKVVSYPNPSELVKGRSLAMSEWCRAATTDAKRIPIERLHDIAGIISSFDILRGGMLKKQTCLPLEIPKKLWNDSVKNSMLRYITNPAAFRIYVQTTRRR